MTDKNKVFDPLRKREVSLTPEEQVRQWFITVMERVMKIPRHMMMSEASLSYGNKRYRADIVVWNRDASPLAIVECKRPDVTLDRAVLEQALRYDIVMDVTYIIITNGLKTFAFRRTENDFEMMHELPQWEYMSRPGTDEPSK